LRISEESNDNGYFVVENFNPEECIGCANCAVMCPDCVIEVER
jgi:2-oxoglutarate ferredoxin oxidoreductase subunit delta